MCVCVRVCVCVYVRVTETVHKIFGSATNEWCKMKVRVKLNMLTHHVSYHRQVCHQLYRIHTHHTTYVAPFLCSDE